MPIVRNVGFVSSSSFSSSSSLPLFLELCSERNRLQAPNTCFLGQTLCLGWVSPLFIHIFPFYICPTTCTIWIGNLSHITLSTMFLYIRQLTHYFDTIFCLISLRSMTLLVNGSTSRNVDDQQGCVRTAAQAPRTLGYARVHRLTSKHGGEIIAGRIPDENVCNACIRLGLSILPQQIRTRPRT